ncbi:MAG TPA: holo-ACP synthase [Gammaproteobacteria bacterium]|nr:holo-ACP synthase [Gammaproteobacteria bacterium]
MILGVGTDLVAVERIRRALDRHGERFLERVLTSGERSVCSGRADPALCVASRFAAKEGAAKALGTGFGGEVRLTDLEVVRSPGRAPELRLHGGAARRAQAMGVVWSHLSLSDEQGYALAVVVLEGEGR